MWLIMRRDAGGLGGGGGWLIWWLEGAEQGWSVAALLWPAACMRKKEGEEEGSNVARPAGSGDESE